MRKSRKRTKKHGYFLIEVVRALHDGDQEILQTEVCSILKQRYKVPISDPTASRIVTELRNGSMGRRWLMPKDGRQGLRLFSEEETIADSSAIKALILANEIMDNDDWVGHEAWMKECRSRFGHSGEVLEGFMREYLRCGYVVEESNKENRRFRINPRRINGDSFYLLPAREANLKRRFS